MEKVKRILAQIEEKGQTVIWLALGLIVSLVCTVFLAYAHFKPKEVVPMSEAIEELMGENEEENLKEKEQVFLQDAEAEQTAKAHQDIVVDIKGEVQIPGVYQMEEGARIIDIIEKAGGLSPEAETTAVNFAQILSDQMVVYIPKAGEELPLDYIHSPVNEETKETETVRVNINTAEKEALMTLKGIGNSKADNILSYREENGFFKTIEEIKNVSGIGEATFENLKDSIMVSP